MSEVWRLLSTRIPVWHENRATLPCAGGSRPGLRADVAPHSCPIAVPSVTRVGWPPGVPWPKATRGQPHSPEIGQRENVVAYTPASYRAARRVEHDSILESSPEFLRSCGIDAFCAGRLPDEA